MSSTVLVADDDEQVRYIATAALSRGGYDVIQAVDGVNALELLKAHRVDLLVTNVVMPRMAGVELVQTAWRTVRADLPVVIMTGYSESHFARELAGRAVVLRKPFEPAALRQAADLALRGAPDSGVV
jgi:CheY-like chemotaxis protein